MQPYLFPHLGYYQLMKLVDCWIVFDGVQYINKGWINRNRILHADKTRDWQFFGVPIDRTTKTLLISNVAIKADTRWRERVIGQLRSYEKLAPHYDRTMALVAECLEGDESNLSKFLERTIRKTAQHLFIETPIHVQSELGLNLGAIEHPGQWALRMSEQMNAKEYINPVGGSTLFKIHEFQKSKIKLSFLQTSLNPYFQHRDSFVGGLSIIDIMMWNHPDEVQNMLINDFKIV